MNPVLLPVTVAIPILGGAVLPLFHFKKDIPRRIYVMAIVLATSVLTWILLLNRPDKVFALIEFTKNLSISFALDGMGSVFAGLVSLLWPLTALYAFEYMTHEGRENTFFTFFTISYGVTLGLAFAEDLLTFYFFYEFLTLVTVPLVLHTHTRDAIHASRKYLYYSLGGAAFAFIGLVFVIVFGTPDFTPGGSLNYAAFAGRENLLLLIYVMAVLGCGVKSAIFPLHNWLISAAVAPTPVTALLHAVAVVKAGVFAIMRITYYNFGADFLRGTWAQYVIMVIAIITIVFGSSMAVHETNFKRRFAYSTVANLSYIIFAVSLMSPAGLSAGLTHMVTHGVVKICLFFCIGAVLYKTGRQQVYELDGIGRYMPLTFAAYTIGSLALTGVPLFAGFISKWNIGAAAVQAGGLLQTAGIGAIMLSALLTAIYSLTVTVRAFFPQQPCHGVELAHDPNARMLVPIVILALACIALGVYSQPLADYMASVVSLL